MITTLQLSRPLNAPLIRVTTNIGARLFLLDTGCPISFAREARYVVAGEDGWFSERTLPLERAPFSLSPLSERLGVHIEGFIGLGDISQRGDMYFDFDQGELRLGVMSEQINDQYKSLQISLPSAERPTPVPLTLELHQARHHPIMIRGELETALTADHQSSERQTDLYLDLGSRFIMTPRGREPKRDSDVATYELDLITPEGAMRAEVSSDHRLQLGEYQATGLCIATGAPAHFPTIIGMEWFTRFNAHLSFSQRKLTLWPRLQKLRSSWEELNASLSAPPLELIFSPDESERDDRSFCVMPRSGHPLPPGVMPMTPYRLRGYSIPRGPEGVNALYEALICSTEVGVSPDPVVMVGPHGEVTLMRTPLFG